jgi:hypothetical protein
VNDDEATADPTRVEQAAEKVAERLQQLGWLEDVARMKREDNDALDVLDGPWLLEVVLKH